MKVFPELRLDHLRAMTDSTGLIQHAIYSVPNRRTGYTTDDNARALIVALANYDRIRDNTSLQLVSTYLSFLHYAQTSSHRFHNFMSYDQMFLDEEGSEDSFGRTLVALGFALVSDIHENVKRVARQLFEDSIHWIPSLTSSRSRAYALCAVCEHHRVTREPARYSALISLLADSLVDMFDRNADENWIWFEPFLTYCNGLLPHSLFLAYSVLQEPKYYEVAVKTMKYLEENTVLDGIFHPIGTEGWYIKGQPRAMYDQQPVDAASFVCAAKTAAKVTGDPHYEGLASIGFEWFFGKNTVSEPMYDPVSGGCYDGLHDGRVNLNQGAESTISYLMAHLAALPDERQNDLIPPP